MRTRDKFNLNGPINEYLIARETLEVLLDIRDLLATPHTEEKEV